MDEAIKYARRLFGSKKQRAELGPKSFIYEGKLYDIQSFEEFVATPSDRRVGGECGVGEIQQPAMPGSCGPRRMIVDCRLASRRFNEPPNAVLVSPESLSTLAFSESDTLYTSSVDVRDLFCRKIVQDESKIDTPSSSARDAQHQKGEGDDHKE